MNVIEFAPGDDYDKRCGEVFLTLKGNLVFHCTLCESRFDGFHEYARHITEHTISSNDIIEATYIKEEDAFDNEGTMIVEEIGSLDEMLYKDVVIEFHEIDERHKKPKRTGEAEREVESRKIRKLKFSTSVNAKESRPHKCSQCDFACRSYSNLLGHIKRHSSVKPHKCPECSKSFYTGAELKKHLRRKNGEKLYLCTDCGQSFPTSGDLSTHAKRHNRVRDKQCTMCEMSFYDNNALRNHLTKHSTARPHKCNICDTTFKLRKTLVNHMKLHENKRTYICEICQAGYNQKPGLLSHMKSKHFIASI